MLLWAGPAAAAGGPLGIDHKLNYDDSGIWKRSNQTALQDLLIGGEVVGALWEGGESRLGKTFWQTIDSSAIDAVSVEALKRIFTRPRPIQDDNPNHWFKGDDHRSFPAGEPSTIMSITMPFVFEYAHDYPAVYALLLVPAYDSVARMKVQAHWQTDVLAGLALGAGTAYFAHTRESPIILSVLPHGFMVGLRHSF